MISYLTCIYVKYFKFLLPFKLVHFKMGSIILISSLFVSHSVAWNNHTRWLERLQLPSFLLNYRLNICTLLVFCLCCVLYPSLSLAWLLNVSWPVWTLWTIMDQKAIRFSSRAADTLCYIMFRHKRLEAILRVLVTSPYWVTILVSLSFPCPVRCDPRWS